MIVKYIICIYQKNRLRKNNMVTILMISLLLLGCNKINLESKYKPTPQELIKKLIDAAKRGDENKVLEALIEGADVNAECEEKKTALMWAVQNRKNKVVSLLLKNGADVNKRILGKKSALMLARDNEDGNMIRILSWYGAK